MSVKVKYKGSDVHKRVLTRADFEKGARLEFPEGTTVKEMVWEPEPERLPVEVPDDVFEVVKDFFDKDPTFEVVEDGEVTSEAKTDGSVDADGNAATRTPQPDEAPASDEDLDMDNEDTDGLSDNQTGPTTGGATSGTSSLGSTTSTR